MKEQRKARISYKTCQGKKELVIELYNQEEDYWGLCSAFPLENFNKNDKLLQILINYLYDLQKNNYEIKYEVDYSLPPFVDYIE